MSKILLIEPAKVIADAKKGMKNLPRCVTPSLGPWSIGTVLKNHSFAVEYFSPNLESINWRFKLEKTLLKNDFDFVGISNTAHTIESDMEIAFLVRKTLPKTIIVTGGYFSHLYPEVILRHTEADIVVRGDGEFPFLHIVKSKNLKEILGVCFRYSQNNQEKYFIQKPYFMSNSEFQKIPPLDFFLFDYQRFWRNWPLIKKEVDLYTSKGCPFACRFCSVPYFNNYQMRFLPLKINQENIIRAVNYGAKKIFFVDPNFSANSKHCQAVCNLIIKLKQERKIPKNLSFIAQARIDLLDRRLLATMSAAGFRWLYLGVENICPRLLKEDINKGNRLNTTQILSKLKLIKSFGLRPSVYLILGIPTTTMEEVAQNIKFARILRKNRIRLEINPFIGPYPETEYYRLYKDTSLIYRKKVIFKRFFHGQPRRFEIRVPEILWPQDSQVKNYLLRLNEKTNWLIQKRGGSFANVFLGEAVANFRSCSG